MIVGEVLVYQGEEFVSDVCTGVFAKRGVAPEDVVALSVFTFASFGWFVLQGVMVSTFIECFLSRTNNNSTSSVSTSKSSIHPSAKTS